MQTTREHPSGISVRELDQPGIEHEGEEEMAPSYEREGEDDGPGVSGNPPFCREEATREEDHRRNRDDTDNERQPESSQDSRDLLEEVGCFDFLLRRTPRDVIREEMREQGFGQMD